MKSIRAKEPTMHKYINQFVEMMKQNGSAPDGISLPTWIQWLAMDMSADMAYHHEVNCIRDSK
jgi:hypothetical protein